MSQFADNLIAFQTLTRREVRRIARIWTQTLIPPIITTTLYYIIFGKLIGSRVGSVEGFSYMSYLVPGMIMMSVVNGSYINASSSFFGVKFQRSIEEMLVAPMSPWTILASYITASIVRGLAVGALVLGVALCFIHLPVAHIMVALLAVLLGSGIFGLAGLINGIYAKKFDDVALVPTFVITPLTYLGGVFYSINMLAEPWRALSQINPILYLVNTLRFGMLGVSDVHVGVALAVMLLFTLALTVFALYLLNRGIGLRS